MRFRNGRKILLKRLGVPNGFPVFLFEYRGLGTFQQLY
jgi:hypothetical protein